MKHATEGFTGKFTRSGKDCSDTEGQERVHGPRRRNQILTLLRYTILLLLAFQLNAAQAGSGMLLPHANGMALTGGYMRNNSFPLNPAYWAWQEGGKGGGNVSLGLTAGGGVALGLGIGMLCAGLTLLDPKMPYGHQLARPFILAGMGSAAISVPFFVLARCQLTERHNRRKPKEL